MTKYKSALSFILITLLLLTACAEKQTEKTAEKDTTAVTAVKPPRPKKPLPEKTKLFLSLPSWNNTSSKKRILSYVKAACVKGGKKYIKPEDRIAVFDNDGTLWAEHPTYFQVEFILDRIQELAPEHPEWKDNGLIRTALTEDLETLRKDYGAGGLGELMAIAQSGMTVSEFDFLVRRWIKKAKNPKTGKLFRKMVYQPMLEVIKLLQKNNFKVYIVSGGGIDFMRAWAEEVYGIPRERIIGSYHKLKYIKKEGKPELIRLPEMLFANDGENKVKAIHRFIGRKPVMAFGNSDGDLQMLEWCGASKNVNLPVYIHHTDAKREWAYDRKSRIGKLDKGLNKAAEKNWLVVDMKKDWKIIYPR
jgi:phosphoserine phosphatase